MAFEGVSAFVTLFIFDFERFLSKLDFIIPHQNPPSPSQLQRAFILKNNKHHP